MSDTKVFTEVLGQVAKSVEGMAPDSEKVVIQFESGLSMTFWHSQDCCECVSVEEVIGDPADLIGAPLVEAEENVSSDEPSPSQYSESHTWTFYRFRTAKGSVVVRWLGESNGYYSERVDWRIQ